MENLSEVVEGSWKAWFGQLGVWWHEARQKGRLREMLQDKEFPKGFRGTAQLMNGIGADRPTTERLLLAIKARKSETSDEWTFQPPRRHRRAKRSAGRV